MMQCPFDEININEVYMEHRNLGNEDVNTLLENPQEIYLKHPEISC